MISIESKILYTLKELYEQASKTVIIEKSSFEKLKLYLDTGPSTAK